MEITGLTEGMLSLTALSCGDKPLCDTRAGAGTVTATGTPCHAQCSRAPCTHAWKWALSLTGSFHLQFNHCLVTPMSLTPLPEIQGLWEQLPAWADCSTNPGLPHSPPLAGYLQLCSTAFGFRCSLFDH